MRLESRAVLVAKRTKMSRMSSNGADRRNRPSMLGERRCNLVLAHAKRSTNVVLQLFVVSYLPAGQDQRLEILVLFALSLTLNPNNSGIRDFRYVEDAR